MTDDKKEMCPVAESLAALRQHHFSALDLLRHSDLREKLIDLRLNGPPENCAAEVRSLFGELVAAIDLKDVEDARVVIFGGGTGLSNIIGGDSRAANWAQRPFHGLKEVFSHITSVVCVTDDGGSTGELLKDMPLPAIGDVRHVLLSSIGLNSLQRIYQATLTQAKVIVTVLARLFNFRFTAQPAGPADLVAWSEADMNALPRSLRKYLLDLLDYLFADARLRRVLARPHCLGNLLLVAAIYRQLPAHNQGRFEETLWEAILVGLREIAERIGAEPHAVYPCTPTPALLRVRYANGVEITGENKSSAARRGFPIEEVFVDFCGHPYVYPEVYRAIAEADIILFAPGSLYSSVIPVFQVPGLAQAVRDNSRALKILVSNLWVQTGETDLSLADPERKFYVSDMIRAYERNIAGGTRDMFHEVLCLSLHDVPASILQRYAVEDKVPIFLDKDVVRAQGYAPVECDIYSRRILGERGVIQHDPSSLAQAVRTLYAGRQLFAGPDETSRPADSLTKEKERGNRRLLLPCRKYQQLTAMMAAWHYQGCGEETDERPSRLHAALSDICWKHYDIAPTHLMTIRGIVGHGAEAWPRDQRYDNIFSFYEPEDGCIHIRREQLDKPPRLELALLIGIGQSLLGNYAAGKRMEDVVCDGLTVGKRYHLLLTDEKDRRCYFPSHRLDVYLRLARMVPIEPGRRYSRLVNGDEGFTPPGLLIGLLYAWYLENRLASHIEYKMAAMRLPDSDLIHEQRRLVARRSGLVQFCREVVFS
jgi:uncharacterized cofD-like protein